MFNLKNKKIIVTGAASGIGRAITLQCINYGATIVAVDINSTSLEALRNFNKEKICIFTADVANYDQVENFFNAIEKSNKYPDCLVNNAGIYYGKSVLEYSEQEIEKILAVNIKSAVYFSQQFARVKLKHKEQGCIINISSVSGQEGSSDAVYGLSKAALIGLTKSNAINFSPYIRVNAIAPGIVATSMIKAIPKKRLITYEEHNLLTDKITPEDVAYTAMFLMSDFAKNYTGTVFDINNGCYLR